jgi:hypothetical protein
MMLFIAPEGVIGGLVPFGDGWRCLDMLVGH